MKSKLMILALAALTLPALSRTNEFRRGSAERGDFDRQQGQYGDRKHKDRFQELTPEQKAEMQERRLILMEKTLKEIGVTDEQKARIIELQQRLKDDMKQNAIEVNEARDTLSRLEKEGASQENLYAAIDEIAAAQSEQMKILIRNRMEMEQILGEEKYKLFMNSARDKWREHGRRGGSSMPPRPGLPPIPGQEQKKSPPPPPPRGASTPPMPEA